MLFYQFFKLFVDEMWVCCLLMIVWEEKVCVVEFIEVLNESQLKIFCYLVLLCVSGVVVDICQGQWVFYCIFD